MGTTPSLFGRFVVVRDTANDPRGTLHKKVVFNGSEHKKIVFNGPGANTAEEQKAKLIQKRRSQNSVSPYEPQGEQVIIDKDASYSRARAGAASNRKERATTILTGGSDSLLGLGPKSVRKVTLLGI